MGAEHELFCDACNDYVLFVADPDEDATDDEVVCSNCGRMAWPCRCEHPDLGDPEHLDGFCLGCMHFVRLDVLRAWQESVANPDSGRLGGVATPTAAAAEATGAGMWGRVPASDDPPELVFWSRGVLPEVADARPYVRWTIDDVEPIRRAYSDLGSRRGFLTRIARQSDGWIITRHPPPGMKVPQIYAEIRPDDAVKTEGPHWHYHPTKPTKGDVPVRPDTGKPLSRRRITSAAAMSRHVEKHKDHNGTNNEDVHMHQKKAKYVFPPGPSRDVTYRHDHATMKPDRRAAHIDKRHAGEDVVGEHSHTKREKDRRESLARRIDVHPWAVPLIEAADVVFFVIEGCLKADAILSAGQAVFSVPSVTLWHAPELNAFAARYLKNKTVVIVPDADFNEAVQTQALLCRSHLRHDLGLDACVASPPADLARQVVDGWTRHGRPPLKAVDDYLATRRSLGSLEVLDLEAPALDHWVALQHGRRDRIARDVRVLEALALHAPSGTVYMSLRTLASRAGVSKSSVSDALASLIEAGALTLDGSMKQLQGRFFGSYYDPSVDWETRPTFTIRDDLRATVKPPATLDSWLQTRSRTLGEAMLNAQAYLELSRKIDAVGEDVRLLLERTLPNEAGRADAEVINLGDFRRAAGSEHA